MIGFLRTLFSWPDGIVVGNLLASAIWAPMALIHIDRRAKKRHEQLKEHIRKHGSRAVPEPKMQGKTSGTAANDEQSGATGGQGAGSR